MLAVLSISAESFFFYPSCLIYHLKVRFVDSKRIVALASWPPLCMLLDHPVFISNRRPALFMHLLFISNRRPAFLLFDIIHIYLCMFSSFIYNRAYSYVNCSWTIQQRSTACIHSFCVVHAKWHEVRFF